MRPWLRYLAFAAFALALGAPVAGVETRDWTASAEELMGGHAEGIAVSALGHLFLAPRTQRLDDALAQSTALEVWSGCRGEQGQLFFGTGPDGVVYRTDGNGRGSEFFRTGEAMVTALHYLSGGDLLAATSPGGRIYRIDSAGTGRLWSETEERYIWAIAETDAGNLFVGSGDRGRVLRVRADGSVETHYDSDEPHIVSLVHDADGVLLAGGGGLGRVYSIDVDGNALVLYDDELDEARAVVRDGTGNWAIALVGAPAPASRRPALKLRLPDGTPVGAVEPNVSIEQGPTPALRGFIEGLEPDAEEATIVRGRLVRLQDDGQATTLWESSNEIPLSVILDAEDRVVLGTGEPARLYRVEHDDEVARIATLQEAHTTVLIRDDRTVFAGTSNPAGVWRVEAIDAEQGAFLSPAYDAGGPSRWGSVSWNPRGRLARTEVYARTGNSPRPDATWSGWSPALVLADGSPLDSPDARYAQIRVRLIGTQDRAARLSGITLTYEPYNRPPSLSPVGLDGFLAVSGTAAFPWKATDPDGDPLNVVLEYRTPFGTDWIVGSSMRNLASEAPDATAAASGVLSWNTSEVAEGVYDARIAVDDRAANDTGEGRRAVGPIRRIVIDRSAPTVDVRELSAGRFEVVVTDESTRVERLTLLQGEIPSGRIRSLDGVCDSRRERFEVTLPDASVGWSVRATDRAGNSTDAVLSAP